MNSAVKEKLAAGNVATIAIATATVAILDACEDILYCRFILHVSAAALFRYIASAVLGIANAISLGWPAVLLGVLLHICVSFSVVLAYFFLSRKFTLLRSRPVAMGAVFGIAVYCVMHYLVVPLTAVPKTVTPSSGIALVNPLFAHIFMVGIPAATILSRLGTGAKTEGISGWERPQARANARPS
jgi:hypothetical protein